MSFHDAIFAIVITLLVYIFSSMESPRVEQRVCLPVKITSLLLSSTVTQFDYWPGLEMDLLFV